mmetsp:Transcript_5191/g.16553  ORF Transcript_5191/g.16553 Transcript_5191/m.16553 type:complete len:254 (+) Transcript_5191:789-1550(+)
MITPPPLSCPRPSFMTPFPADTVASRMKTAFTGGGCAEITRAACDTGLSFCPKCASFTSCSAAWNLSAARARRVLLLAGAAPADTTLAADADDAPAAPPPLFPTRTFGLPGLGMKFSGLLVLFTPAPGSAALESRPSSLPLRPGPTLLLEVLLTTFPPSFKVAFVFRSPASTPAVSLIFSVPKNTMSPGRSASSADRCAEWSTGGMTTSRTRSSASVVSGTSTGAELVVLLTAPSSFVGFISSEDRRQSIGGA